MMDAPPAVTLDFALHSSDPATRTMARVLDLLTLLVPASLAMLHTIDGRLEKYAPVLIATKPLPPRDLDHAIRAYHQRYARDDPFSPRRAARSRARMLTPADLDGPPHPEDSWCERELSMTLAAELYLRAAGRIIAGISLMRDPRHPRLSPGEIAVLHHAHTLAEDAYTLALRRSPRSPGHDALQRHHDRLTARERQIAELIAAGASNGEIAETLQIAPTTAKTHVRHVLAKLGATNRRQAMRLLTANATHVSGS